MKACIVWHESNKNGTSGKTLRNMEYLEDVQKIALCQKMHWTFTEYNEQPKRDIERALIYFGIQTEVYGGEN